MSPLAAIAIVLATVLAMEGVAWASHKYIMHGFGWGWHRDHHEPHDKVFEKNDLYGIVGAAISISLFAYGRWGNGGAGWEAATWMGVGVLIYGIVYTAIHDGLIHQRWFRYVPKRGYAKRIVQAHKLHHATLSKEGGVSFGFVVARRPERLKADLKRQREAGLVRLRDAEV